MPTTDDHHHLLALAHTRRTKPGPTPVMQHQRKVKKATKRPNRGYQRKPKGERYEVPVAALYVEPDGPYADLVHADNLYDEKRDASTYRGPHPVVAHPPCRSWGKLKWRAKGNDHHLALQAVVDVRRWGGILEHPVGSGLWEAAGIKAVDWHNPDRPLDEFGGYTLRVRQWDHGHRGIKDTILYIVGLEELPAAFGLAREGGDPAYVQNMSQKERLLSPAAFAYALTDAASRAMDGPSWRKHLGIAEPQPSTGTVRVEVEAGGDAGAAAESGWGRQPAVRRRRGRGGAA